MSRQSHVCCAVQQVSPPESQHRIKVVRNAATYRTVSNCAFQRCESRPAFEEKKRFRDSRTLVPPGSKPNKSQYESSTQSSGLDEKYLQLQLRIIGVIEVNLETTDILTRVTSFNLNETRRVKACFLSTDSIILYSQNLKRTSSPCHGKPTSLVRPCTSTTSSPRLRRSVRINRDGSMPFQVKT